MASDGRSRIMDHPVVSHAEWLSARTARDVTMIAVSRAPYSKLAAYQK